MKAAGDGLGNVRRPDERGGGEVENGSMITRGFIGYRASAVGVCEIEARDDEAGVGCVGAQPVHFNGRALGAHD